MTFEDPAQLEFRRAPHRRPRRRSSYFSSQAVWLVVAIVAALVFVLLVRTMLARSAWTAGHSPDVASEASFVPSDAELNREPWPQLPQPEAAATSHAVVSPQAQGRAVVYRCVGKGGAVSFQSQPCGDDQRTTRVLDATPVYEAPRRSRTPGASPSMAQSYTYASTVADNARERQRLNCLAAKRRREATLEQVGLARTYELLQSLDAMVYEACKGL